MRDVNEFFGTYLKATDLVRPVTVTIESIDVEEIEDRELKRPVKKLVLSFVGKEKGLVLNRVNSNTLIQLTGTRDMDKWPGFTLTLYNDPNVTFGSNRGGIRIRPAAGTNESWKGATETAAAPPPPPPTVPPPDFEDDVPF